MPRSLPEYLTQCCGLDFHALLAEYGLRQPARLREALGCAEGTPIRHVGTRLLRTESVLEQPEEELAADLVLRGDYLAAEEGGERRCSAEFRFRCVLDLSEGGAGFRRLYAAPRALISEDAVTRQTGTATDRWLLPLLNNLTGVVNGTVEKPGTKTTLIILGIGAALTVPLLPLRSMVTAAFVNGLRKE